MLKDDTLEDDAEALEDDADVLNDDADTLEDDADALKDNTRPKLSALIKCSGMRSYFILYIIQPLFSRIRNYH